MLKPQRAQRTQREDIRSFRRWSFHHSVILPVLSAFIRVPISHHPVPPRHLLRRLPAGQAGKLFLLHKHQRAGGAGLHAGRDLPVGAAVAFQRDAPLPLPPNNPVGANHGAHPAADAAVGVMGHNAGDGVLGHRAGAAGGHAGGVLAVAAEEGHLPLQDVLHVEPTARARRLGNRPEEGPGARMLHRAGQFAGVATHTAVQADKDFSHRTPPLTGPARPASRRCGPGSGGRP